MKHFIETSDVEDSILTPYAKSQNTTVAALISANGKAQVVQSALRSFCQKAASTGAIDQAVAQAVLKDENAIWNAVHSDWNGAKAFAGIIAAVLSGEAAPAKAAV